MRYLDVTGVILAGGKSTRMGRDKATLDFDGMPLYRRTFELLKNLFPAVLLAGDRPELALPGLKVVPDRYPGSALGGLYTALSNAETPWVFVTACDMPLIDPKVIEALLVLRQGYDVVVPSTSGGLEPLFACYHRNCLEPMRQMLEQGQYRIFDFYQQLSTRYVLERELPEGGRKSLTNVNNPGDLHHLGGEADAKC